MKNPITLSGDISQIVRNALSGNVEESFKKFLDADPEVDDFQNLICSSLSTVTSAVKIFVKIHLVVLT